MKRFLSLFLALVLVCSTFVVCTASSDDNQEVELDAPVENAKLLIDAIGDITFTQECSEKINAANAAVSNLSDEQKQLLGNVYLTILNEANLKYADLNTAQAVINAINDFSPITWAKKDMVVNARSAYENLNEIQKEYVTNLSVLEEAEQYIIEVAEVRDDFIKKVESLGEIRLTNECHAELAVVRNAYVELHNLNDSTLIADVKNYLDILEAKENQIRALESAVNELKRKIDSIGEVTLTEDCAVKIQTANAELEKLNDDQLAWLGIVYRTILHEANLKFAEKLEIYKHLGDVDCDNVVTMQDALLALHHALEKVVLNDNSFVYADVNYDGIVEIADALVILQYVVGKIDSFPSA